MQDDKIIRVEAKRRKRRFPYGMAVLLLIMAGLLGLMLVRITNITIEGNSYYTDEQLEQIIFSARGSRHSVLFFLQEHFGSRREIPFVEKYTVRQNNLTSVEITVYEKTVAGYMELMDHYLYFDWDGLLIETGTELIPGVIKVTGLQPTYAVLGEVIPTIDDTYFRVILNISQFLKNTTIMWNGQETPLSELIGEISFDGKGNVSCRPGSICVVLGDYSHMEDKLREMAAILPKLSGKAGTLYLDTYKPQADRPSYVFKPAN